MARELESMGGSPETFSNRCLQDNNLLVRSAENIAMSTASHAMYYFCWGM